MKKLYVVLIIVGASLAVSVGAVWYYSAWVRDYTPYMTSVTVKQTLAEMRDPGLTNPDAPREFPFDALRQGVPVAGDELSRARILSSHQNSIYNAIRPYIHAVDNVAYDAVAGNLTFEKNIMYASVVAGADSYTFRFTLVPGTDPYYELNFSPTDGTGIVLYADYLELVDMPSGVERQALIVTRDHADLRNFLDAHRYVAMPEAIRWYPDWAFTEGFIGGFDFTPAHNVVVVRIVGMQNSYVSRYSQAAVEACKISFDALDLYVDPWSRQVLSSTTIEGTNFCDQQLSL